MSDRHTVISCDCHATARPEEYLQYVDAAYRDAYEASVEVAEARAVSVAKAMDAGQSLFSKEGVEDFAEEAGDGKQGQWDSDVRVKELEADGVVAEIIFPNGAPFAAAFGGQIDHELNGVGTRAYNRWLVDFCDALPGRRAGLALLAVHDIDAAVAEIAWAKDNGLKGVILPTTPGEGLPIYLDPIYEPIWSAVEEHDIPLHTHGGGGTPAYGDYGAASMLTYATETTFFAHRPFWFLVWSGVFERHPDLTFVCTEQKADWVPTTLEYLDGIYAQRFFSHIRETVRHKPSEYWARQCHVGASFMTRDEAMLRGRIGINQMMWGSDYPHVEGTWPKSKKSLNRVFKGIPVEDARAILSENPARLYGFDLDLLAPIAERVGPTVEELAGA
jgi:predicted TIM-barrel fold metal-dependent hydrolase